MRWVNDTFPPRPRLRWLLITMRLSTRSLAGIARTLVAVGTDRLAAMFAAVRAAAPRSRTSVAPAGAGRRAGPGPVRRPGAPGPARQPPGAGRPASGDSRRRSSTRPGPPNRDPPGTA